MGLLDYYRQFSGLTEEEVNAGLREQAAERRRRALTRVDELDLSSLTWPELPPPDVVNAVTYVARRGLHRYLDPQAGELRAELAAGLGVETDQVAVGNGAAQLLTSAAQVLLEPGDELVCPWPSYPLFPVMARRARARAVPVPGWGAEAVLRALNERTRVVALANPNDPTGALLDHAELDHLLAALPERVVLLLDEALVDFGPPGADRAALDLLERHPRLLVVRTFSKAWGLAGLRCGFAVGATEAAPLLERLAPELGVGELVQAGALEALRAIRPTVERRAAGVRAEAARLVPALRTLGLDVPDTHANAVWLGRPGLDGAELAARLDRARLRVASGAQFGDPDRVRVAIQTPATSDRLLQALEAVL